MVKFVLAMVVGVAMAGVASAQDTPVAPITNSQSCFSAVDALAQNWENHKYASQALKDKIGAALHSLEKQCENNAFPDAQKAALELKTQISQ